MVRYSDLSLPVRKLQSANCWEQKVRSQSKAIRGTRRSKLLNQSLLIPNKTVLVKAGSQIYSSLTKPEDSISETQRRNSLQISWLEAQLAQFLWQRRLNCMVCIPKAWRSYTDHMMQNQQIKTWTCLCKETLIVSATNMCPPFWKMNERKHLMENQVLDLLGKVGLNETYFKMLNLKMEVSLKPTSAVLIPIVSLAI